MAAAGAMRRTSTGHPVRRSSDFCPLRLWTDLCAAHKKPEQGMNEDGDLTLQNKFLLVSAARTALPSDLLRTLKEIGAVDRNMPVTNSKPFLVNSRRVFITPQDLLLSWN